LVSETHFPALEYHIDLDLVFFIQKSYGLTHFNFQVMIVDMRLDPDLFLNASHAGAF